MAEAFSVAASTLAVGELSAKIIKLCLQYSRDVKHAKDDIERVIKEVTNWKTIAEKLRDLLDSPQGTRLQASLDMRGALEDSRSQLGSLHEKLTPDKRRQAMSRVGLRALKWPFDSKEVEKILQNLSRRMQLARTALQIDQTVAVLTIEQKAVLRTLPEATGVAFDSHAQEHNPTCLSDTRVDLLHEIYKWVEEPDAKAVFWLNGMAGTGKSTISRTLAQAFSDRGQLGASFFFKRGEVDRSSISKFFTTIAAQLIRREPALAVHVKDAIDADPAICDKKWSEQFEKLIFEPLLRIFSNDRKADVLVIVIDALDECEQKENIEQIIRLLSRAKDLHLPRLRIFLTSRPESSVRRNFYLDPVKNTYQDLILHDIERSVIKSDLSVYFKYKLSEIRKEYNSNPRRPQLPLTWPEQLEIQALVEMAAPLFIFAATLCLFLSDSRIGTPVTKLEEILEYQTKSQESELDTIYLLVLDQLLVGLSGSDRSKKLELFKHLVGSIILLANPLSTPALAHLLSISQAIIDDHLDYLHSVLSIPSLPDSPVRLLHLSFRDFLIDPLKRGTNLFWIDEKETHKQLAADCLRVMSETLCTDMCEVRWPGTAHASFNPQAITDKLPPGVQYACQYWVYHVQQAGRDLLNDDQIYEFLQQHFLHWLEALSLIGRASESLQNIEILQSLLQFEDSSRVSHFINDALRFARINISAIQAAPLQAYCSALIFAPKTSIIRNTFQNNIPDWISLSPKVNIGWSSCLQTLEGHTDRVYSVAFSRDGNTLASASGDKTVRVWSAATGACLQTLEGHTDWVYSVAFSRDGNTLASASEDKTVRVWSAATGNCLLSIYLGIISYTLSFDPDGRSLVTEAGALSLGHLLQPPLITALDNSESSTSSLSSFRASPDYDQERRLGYGISSDRFWITLSGKDLLWLPADCRPGQSAIFGTTVAIGTNSGRIVIMRFSIQGLAGL